MHSCYLRPGRERTDGTDLVAVGPLFAELIGRSQVALVCQDLEGRVTWAEREVMPPNPVNILVQPRGHQASLPRHTSDVAERISDVRFLGCPFVFENPLARE